MSYRKINTSQDFALNRELKRMWDAIDKKIDKDIFETKQELQDEVPVSLLNEASKESPKKAKKSKTWE